MQPRGYVAVTFAGDGSRRFCADAQGKEWTDDFDAARAFEELHQAVGVAVPHGGLALPWSDMHALEATS